MAFPLPLQLIRRGALLLPLLLCCAFASAASTCKLHIVAHVPPDSGVVYIAGNLTELGPWDPAKLAMTGSEGRRDATLEVPTGTTVEFKLTRGEWTREALDARHGLRKNEVVTVDRDMEYTVHVGSFRVPYEEEFAAEMKPASTEGATVVIASPMHWQVVQRRTREEGEVAIRGRVTVPCDTLRVQIVGRNWKGRNARREAPIAVEKDGTFDQTVTVTAGGWYCLEADALKDGAVVGRAVVEHFGVGEVFVGAGQSNSTSCAQYRTRQRSGMVSSFSGDWWRPADDPQPGAHDKSLGGSFWPSFGDAMYARYHVPIGVAATGHSGSSTKQWTPGGELHDWMMTRIGQLGPHGFRAVLWHQGSADSTMDGDEYFRRSREIVEGARKAAGWDIPWFNAQTSYHNAEKPAFPQIRAAQERLWKEAVTLRGPDTDKLTGKNRDFDGTGIHFSPKGLKAHGRMWAKSVGPWLDAQLKGE